MGQKTSPIGFRLGTTKEYNSVWFFDKDYANYVYQDYKMREIIYKDFKRAGIANININRRAKQVEVSVHTAKPGLIIGKGGVEAEKLKRKLQSKFQAKIQLNIIEEKNVDLSAPILGEGIARQLEKRVAFRKAMKQAIGRAQKSGAKGIKVMCAGRLGGTEIARTEWYREGRVPLQTIRSDIDYAFIEANTIYGKIGIKVWIYKGDVIRKKQESPSGEAA
jgi:small subunit ribosomal protein S3